MKTVTEWSLEFDLMYNNISSDKAPGLTLYEKSVFLTRAQEAIVVALYKGSLGDAFESTEEVAVYLSPLVKQQVFTGETDWKEEGLFVIDPDKSHLYNIDDDTVLFRTLEYCMLSNVPNCSGSVRAEVVPITQDEYHRTTRNPFKKQNGRRVLRMVYSTTGTDSSSKMGCSPYTELISDYTIDSYTLRYLQRPEPIILGGCSQNGPTINGKYTPQTCLLDEALHETILAESVRMAKATWNA